MIRNALTPDLAIQSRHQTSSSGQNMEGRHQHLPPLQLGLVHCFNFSEECMTSRVSAIADDRICSLSSQFICPIFLFLSMTARQGGRRMLKTKQSNCTFYYKRSLIFKLAKILGCEHTLSIQREREEKRLLFCCSWRCLNSIWQLHGLKIPCSPCCNHCINYYSLFCPDGARICSHSSVCLKSSSSQALRIQLSFCPILSMGTCSKLCCKVENETVLQLLFKVQLFNLCQCVSPLTYFESLDFNLIHPCSQVSWICTTILL